MVEDSEQFRKFICSTLGERPELQIVGEDTDGLQALQRADELQPDLILLDIGLPSLNGIEVARQILKLSPKSKILFVSQESSADVVREALGTGAHGYVLKTIDSDLLIQSIRAVSNGQSILNPALTQRALDWIKAGTVRVQSLSPQEERVLALVAEGLTNKEIATTMQLSDKTVKNYLANMFQKLHISRRAQAATFFVKRQA